MGDLREFDPGEFISNLRMLSDARGPMPEPEPEWRERRKERLRSLEIDPEHVRLALSSERCPSLVGHAGSVAASQAAEHFVSDQRFRLLVLGGPTGRGKSATATWIAGTLEACWWISAKDVRVGDAWSQAFPRALKAAILVIDDLGQEGNDWASKELGSLMESRFDKGRRTVATTNLPLASLAKAYGDRLASRLSRPKVSEYVICGGGDLRRGSEVK
jgi:hypothetical protein